MPLNPEEYLKIKFDKLNKKINKHEEEQGQKSKSFEEECNVSLQSLGKGVGSLRATLDDIEKGIKQSSFKISVPAAVFGQEPIVRSKPPERMNPFIKVTLKKTPDILLFEQRSITVIKDSEEGLLVEEDNERYEYLTEGPGRKRTCFSVESQTPLVTTKTRAANTDSIAKDHVASYVSNFEMFDTYNDLEKTTTKVDIGGVQSIQVTTYKVGGVDQFIDINKIPEFKLALMLTTRILAGNNYEKFQRRFRNMSKPDPLALEVRYLYRLELLWTFSRPFSETQCQAVSDMAWCPNNGDILAVSYGAYTTTFGSVPQDGCVCVWNIKNPVNPERTYHFNAPVQTIEFSPFVPQLLAVGLYDGSVFVYDISNMTQPQIAVSQRSTSSSCDPITSIKWIPHSPCDTKLHSIEPFLVLTRDSSVMRYTIINSPHLLGISLMQVERVDGNAEGILLDNKLSLLEANRHPQGLDICLDAGQQDVYYVLTDEGCQHKCSINYPNQQMGLLQLHEAGINHMEFSPWSPKLYLTCGNDWCIRIWLLGIFKPIITLKYHMSPVCSASWSTEHSSIIVALHRDTIDIWDLRKSILKPASSKARKIADKRAYYTTFKLSLCGRSVVVGNYLGNVEMFAFEDMPFPPHFQYEHLAKTIYKILSHNPELLKCVRSIGYFGYPKK